MACGSVSSPGRLGRIRKTKCPRLNQRDETQDDQAFHFRLISQPLELHARSQGEGIDIISVDTFAIEIKVRVLDPNFHRRSVNCLMQGNADTGSGISVARCVVLLIIFNDKTGFTKFVELALEMALDDTALWVRVVDLSIRRQLCLASSIWYAQPPVRPRPDE